MCLLSVICWLFIGIRAAKSKADFFHPLVVFSILFVISYPAKLMLSFHGLHIMDSMSVAHGTILWSIVIFNVAAIFFCLPLMLSRKVSTSREAFRIAGFSPFIAILVAILVLIASHGVDAFRAIFSLEGLQGRIGERADERVGAGLISLLRLVGIYLLVVFSLKRLVGKRKIVSTLSLVVLYSALALLISGSKFEALLLPFVFIATWYYVNRSLGINVLNTQRLLLGVIAALFLIGLTGYIRGAGAWGEYDHPFLWQTLYQLAWAFDAPDNFIVILSRASTWIDGEIGFRLWADYLLFPFVPRFLWPGKPLVQGNQLIMQEYFPERFGGHLGEAISPSFPGEMILTGGILYMAVWLLILGFGVAALYRKAQAGGGFYYVAYMWVLLNIFNFLRSGTGTVGSFVLFVLVSVFTYVGFHIMKSIVVERKKSRVPEVGKSNP